MVTWNTNDTKDNRIYIRDSIKCCKQIRVKGFITLIKKKEKSHPNRHIIMENKCFLKSKESIAFRTI